MQQATNLPWVIVDLACQAFAINSRHVREIIISPPVAEVPGRPPWIRGVITLRGRVLPLVDLRKRLGRTSALEDLEQLCSLLEQREQDHRRWLAELESSIREHRPFTLAVDPHKCAFGRWYDNYSSDKLVVAEFLKRFDAPHKAIHAVAAQATGLVAEGRQDGALELLAEVRETVLSRLIELFGTLRKLVRESQREVAVVIEGSRAFAVCADAVTAVERLAPDAAEALDAVSLGIEAGSAVGSILKLSRGTALVLDVERLFAASDQSWLAGVPASAA